jgi:Predicted pyrophosphatase
MGTNALFSSPANLWPQGVKKMIDAHVLKQDPPGPTAGAAHDGYMVCACDLALEIQRRIAVDNGLFKGLEFTLVDVVAWSRATFPHSTTTSKAEHLLKEAKELRNAVRSGRLANIAAEVADVQMLLAHIAASQGIDLAQAVADKLAVVKKRRWGTPDANGVVEHVRSRKGAR